jgi:hypothetical protein
MELNIPKDIVPIAFLARKLRVPLKWLRSEAENGRIPHIKAGKNILVNPKAVERVLAERAKKLEHQGADAVPRGECHV